MIPVGKPGPSAIAPKCPECFSQSEAQSPKWVMRRPDGTEILVDSGLIEFRCIKAGCKMAAPGAPGLKPSEIVAPSPFLSLGSNNGRCKP